MVTSEKHNLPMAIPTSAVGPFRSIMTGYADNFGYLLNYYIYLYLELFGYIPREEYTCEGGIGDNGSSFWGSAGLLIVYETFNVVRENLNYKKTCCRRREFKIIRIMLEWDGLELFRHIQKALMSCARRQLMNSKAGRTTWLWRPTATNTATRQHSAPLMSAYRSVWSL